MTRFSTGVTLVMLAIFAGMVGVATTYPAGARFMPLVIGLPAIGLCLMQLVADFMAMRRKRRGARAAPTLRAGKQKPAVVADLAVTEVEEPEFGPHTVAAEIVMWAYFVGFVAAVLLFGFVLSIPVMVGLYLWREARVRPLYAFGAGVVFAALVHVMFARVLAFQLHEGFLTARLLTWLGW